MNVAKLEKESMIANLKVLRAQNPDKTEDINKIISFIKKQKYGLNFEQHTERVDEELKTNLPVLQEREKIQNGQDDDYNFLIEGDNLVALKLLEKTHKGRIGVIYIDPPYNTLKDDFAYDDKMVDESDLFAHSKWLSFMKERLEIAQQLLAEDGVIFISIDDREQAQLKLLCDKIFQKENFITSFVWEKTHHTGKQTKNACCNVDYVLVYAKELIRNVNGKPEVKRLLVDHVVSDFEDAPLYNASNNIHTMIFPKGTVFCKKNFDITETTNVSYKLLSRLKTKVADEPFVVNDAKYKYVNSEDVVMEFPSRWVQAEIDRQIELGTKFIIKTDGCAIRAVYSENKDDTPIAPWQIIKTGENGTITSTGKKVGTNEEGSSMLETLINDKDTFSYPKPVSLIKYLIGLTQDKNAIVLDFFSGSGTTSQAVLELNSEDNGHRHFILCTNNELGKKASAKAKALNLEKGTDAYEALGICRAVTYPRVKTVITGIKPNGTKYSDGLPANLKYMQTAMIPKYDEQGFIRNELRGEVSTYTEALIELKDAVNLPDNRVAVIWDKIGLDELMGSDLKKLHTIYMDMDSVMLNAKQEKFISKMQTNGVQILNIPKYYYKEVQ